MKDTDIRKILLHNLHEEHANDSDTIIIEEFGLCQGDARIDIAVINTSLHGFEIKSEEDNLSRLLSQSSIYNSIFDYVTIVANSNHIPKIMDIVPKWWGISVVKMGEDKLGLTELRSPKRNKQIIGKNLVQLLWRDEAIDILKDRQLHRGFTNRSRNILWGRILDCLSIHQLHHEIREKIKSRTGWRVGQLQRSCGD